MALIIGADEDGGVIGCDGDGDLSIRNRPAVPVFHIANERGPGFIIMLIHVIK